ncbi:hypothetical protein FRB90_003301, partial [Tulasnella sp. 427]
MGLMAVGEGKPVHWEIPPSLVFKDLVLTTGDQVAERIFPRETSLIMFDGNWSTTYPAPAAYTVTGGEFLALSTHASGWFWTSALDSGIEEQPNVITELDAGGRALELARPQIHVTKGFEYRWQKVGFVFIYLLTWVNSEAATPEARAFWDKCMNDHDWQNIVHAGSGLAEFVSTWHSVCACPGSFLILPPGTPVIEYSLGAS